MSEPLLGGPADRVERELLLALREVMVDRAARSAARCDHFGERSGADPAQADQPGGASHHPLPAIARQLVSPLDYDGPHSACWAGRYDDQHNPSRRPPMP